MRIVFMGTPDFAVPCLERLVADGHEVVGVLSQPDKPRGRGYELAATPVKVAALAHGLAVYQPTKLRDGTALTLLERLSPELVVVVAYGRILPVDLLNVPTLGCINVHGSLLPAYRGSAPIQWTVLNGDPVGGVTSMYMAAGMDTGDTIMTIETPVGDNETSGELYARLAPMGAECLSRTVGQIAAGTATRTVQDDSRATLAPMLDKAMGEVDWTQDAQRLHNLVRGLNPWPGAYTHVGDRLLKLHDTRVVDASGRPGELLDAKECIVACGSGALRLVAVQPEGKPRMAGADYLRGIRRTTGELLTDNLQK